MSGNPDPAGDLSIGCRCGYPAVDATEKERQASTLAVLVLVGALERGGDVSFSTTGRCLN